MQKLLKLKSAGMRGQLMDFAKRVADFPLRNATMNKFSDMLVNEMKELGFDEVIKDKAGNIIGIIKGYGGCAHMASIAHMDLLNPEQEENAQQAQQGMVRYKSGIISNLYAGGLLKRALLPMQGDLFICCVPRFECSDFGIRYLFEELLGSQAVNMKGVLLCEPTDFNVFIGHKGRMEYEIIVKGKINKDFIEHRGMNMLGAMFPLINELESAAKQMPNDFSMGRSMLKIKDVRFSGYRPQDEKSEFRIVVDRVFIPEEDINAILQKAKRIAKRVYKGETSISVNTVLAKETVRSYTGFELLSSKEFKPWSIPSHHPLVMQSIETLGDNGFKSTMGFWKNIVTEGSYTYGKLNIPTIGFGAGSDGLVDSGPEMLNIDQIDQAVYGQALIIERNIGIPAFGWGSDEI